MQMFLFPSIPVKISEYNFLSNVLLKLIDVKLNLWNGDWWCEIVTVGQDDIINSSHSGWLNNNPILFSTECTFTQICIPQNVL